MQAGRMQGYRMQDASYSFRLLQAGRQAIARTKKPKKRAAIFENAPPPPRKKIVFLLGLASQNRYDTQTLLLSEQKKNYLCCQLKNPTR
jgi:hypothetical protein